MKRRADDRQLCISYGDEEIASFLETIMKIMLCLPENEQGEVISENNN